MAKTATMASQEGGTGITAIPGNWYQKVKAFYTDVRMEMKKVTSPSLKEVRATTTVVIIAVLIFGVYFWLVDGALTKTLDYTYRYFTVH